MCERHQKALTLFCKDDGKLVCPGCAGSADHTAHILLSAEDAAEEYKQQLQIHLQVLTEERKKALDFQTKEENKNKEFLEMIEGEKQKIVSKFEEVQIFLKEQKKAMLDKLDELVKKQEEYALRLSREIFVFDTIIHDMEGKYKQPASIFLQDVGETLSRCKMWEFQEPPEVSSELEEKLCAISKNYLILQEHMQVFRETFPEEAAVKWVKITFDPDTAHPKLQVSADQKILREATSSKKSYPQRFTAATCVLGCEGFSSGRHYWEVKVREEAHWAVGVARESVDRKEKLELNPKEGIWVIKNEYKELRADSCYLYSSIPKTVGVFLDYRLRRVLFFDADDGRTLYTFHSVSLQDQKIRPFFWLQMPWDCKAEACYIELCA